MKKLIPLVAVASFFVFVTVKLGLAAWTVNGWAPGSSPTSTPTPIAVGTSTPVKIMSCATTLNAASSNTNTNYFKVSVKGGTLNTDNCFLMWAPAASPCAAATPAPNAGVGFGDPIPMGGAGYLSTPYNYLQAGGSTIYNSELDAVCTAAATVIVTAAGSNP